MLQMTLVRSLLKWPQFAYLVFSTIFAYTLFLTVSFWSNIHALLNIPFLSWEEVLSGIFSLYTHPLINLSPFSLIVVCIVSVLMGVNVSLIMYIRFQRMKVGLRSTLSSGAVSSLLLSVGMGCAACGSIVLVSAFTWLGFVVGPAMVWWATNTFLVGSMLLLFYTNYRLYQQALHPTACRIDA